MESKKKMSKPVLIKNTKKVIVENSTSDAQEAKANFLADQRLKENSANDPLYILSVEDPTVRGKLRTIVATKLRDGNPIYLDVIGFEIDKNASKKFESYNDIEDYVKTEETVKFINVRFPWTRVINIENRTFKRK